MIDLLRVLQLFCLNIGCWHALFEKECGNPYVPYQQSMNEGNYMLPISECGSMCPHCDGTKERMFHHVFRSGVCNFLVSSFIIRNDGELTPEKLAKNLFDFPNVGKIVYNRQKSLNAESISVTQMTIMQLLAADIITLEIEESDKPVARCKLSIDIETSTPHYLINKFWVSINTFNTN
jgi:hypothetical protein